VIQVRPGYVEDSYGAAVDIGSTTIALYLCDLRTGEILAAESEMNPQIIYGEDIMSRIQYTIEREDGLAKLNKAVIDTLNRLLEQAVQAANMPLGGVASDDTMNQFPDEVIVSGTVGRGKEIRLGVDLGKSLSGIWFNH